MIASGYNGKPRVHGYNGHFCLSAQFEASEGEMGWRNHHSLRDSYVADIAKVRHCIQSLKYMITKLAQMPWPSAGRPLLVLSFGACERWFFRQKRRHTNLWL